MSRILFALWMTTITTLAFAQATASLPSKDSGNYSGLCEDQWTKRGTLDREMFSYCIRRENDAYDQLSREIEKYNNLPWLHTALDDAVRKWTKRESRDDTMVAYTVHQQIDAYLDMEYASHQPNFQNSQYQACAQKWGPSDWGMIEYCYKNATEQ